MVASEQGAGAACVGEGSWGYGEVGGLAEVGGVTHASVGALTHETQAKANATTEEVVGEEGAQRESVMAAWANRMVRGGSEYRDVVEAQRIKLVEKKTKVRAAKAEAKKKEKEKALLPVAGGGKCGCARTSFDFGAGNKKCPECGHSPMRHYSYFNRCVLNPIQRYGYRSFY
jgi:hypothetical protein